MRFFFENLLTLHPQNLIPEAVWMGVSLHILVLLACFHSILYFSSLGLIGKVLWGVVAMIPFLGPIAYASYRLKTSESSLKEIWAAHDKIVD